MCLFFAVCVTYKQSTTPNVTGKINGLNKSVFHSVDTNTLLCEKWMPHPRALTHAHYTYTTLLSLNGRLTGSAASAHMKHKNELRVCDDTAVSSHYSLQRETTARLVRPAPRSLVETGKDDQARKPGRNAANQIKLHKFNWGCFVFLWTAALISTFFVK